MTVSSLLSNLFYYLRPYSFVVKQISNLLNQGAKIEKLAYPLHSLSHVHIYQFSIFSQEHSRKITGLGYDENENLALIKAFFEYYERLSMFNDKSSLFKTTNGIAAHIYSSLAKKTALHELYERDSFLRHWYCEKGYFIFFIVLCIYQYVLGGKRSAEHQGFNHNYPYYKN